MTITSDVIELTKWCRPTECNRVINIDVIELTKWPTGCNNVSVCAIKGDQTVG